MKLLVPFLCFISMAANGKYPPVVNWHKSTGGSGNDAFEKILPTPDGGFAAVCSSQSADGDVPLNKGYYDELW